MGRLGILAAFLMIAGRARAEPPALAIGLEWGGWPQIEWFGGAFEADEYLNQRVAIHAHVRWQGFSQGHDECTFDHSGQQLDATLGIRLDTRPFTDTGAIHPFLAASFGGGAERVLSACVGSSPHWRGSPIAAIAAGLDVRDDPDSRAAFRLELRATAADFVSGPNAPFVLGSSDQAFNQEISVAALYVVRL